MDNDIGRREFLTLVSGATAALVSACGTPKRTDTSVVGPMPNTNAFVPKRPFGSTGAQIAKLTLGGASVVNANGQELLDQALRYGIDSWEFTQFTGPTFGDYFRTHPVARERVFLSAKASSTTPNVMQDQLEKALTANQTSTIDFFAVHGIEDVAVLTNDVRQWAERAKREGNIRFFGFCTHKKMESCLEQGSELGWIDGIQVSYNYRMQSIDSIEAALRKCRTRGIGIITVKSMALCVKSEAEFEELSSPRNELITELANHGLSFEQAKLKAIWENPSVTSVCSLMPNASVLRANAVAAMDEQRFSGAITDLLAAYADCTGKYYCRRCGTCETTTTGGSPIFNAMEALMYARSYGQKDLAAKLFAMIPVSLRHKIPETDFSQAERLCPQRMPIAELMREALQDLNR